MPDRINHVKLVTPDPLAVERFLTEILDVPKGWPLGEASPPTAPVLSPARDADGNFTADAVMAFRGSAGEGMSGGMIVGDVPSRQFQVLAGEKAHIWAIAVGTRHIERAHERAEAAGIAVTPIDRTAWGDGSLEFFFAEVGGIVFEVLRAVES